MRSPIPTWADAVPGAAGDHAPAEHAPASVRRRTDAPPAPAAGPGEAAAGGPRAREGGTSSPPAEAYEGARPLRPRPVVVAAVMESVGYGLMARHAYAEGLPVAMPLTLGFIFLVPAIAGYRTATGSDEPRVATLTPAAMLLMVLAAAVALGGPGIVSALVLMPFFMLMALLGGALGLGLRGACDAAVHAAQRLARAARPLRAKRAKRAKRANRAERAPAPSPGQGPRAHHG